MRYHIVHQWSHKKDCLVKFQKSPPAAPWLRRRRPYRAKVNYAELFVCKLYKISDKVHSKSEARLHLFVKQKSPEALPPTSDSLCQHMRRIHYQTMVWKISCQCKAGCGTMRCKCRKCKRFCTGACRCIVEDRCFNINSE